jgi:putative nucleotidyltransferase with HDIG domain
MEDKFKKLLLSPIPSKELSKKDNLEYVLKIIPELSKTIGLEQNKYHFGDVWSHTLMVMDNVEPILVLRLSALLHDIGKPKVKKVTETGIHFYKHDFVGAEMSISILKRLEIADDLHEIIYFLINKHMITKQWLDDLSGIKDKSLARFVRKINDNNKLELLLKLIHADNISHSKEYCLYNQVNNFWEKIKTIKI